MNIGVNVIKKSNGYYHGYYYLLVFIRTISFFNSHKTSTQDESTLISNN